MKSSNNEMHATDEDFRKKTLSWRSLAAISLESTGRELDDGVSRWLSLNLEEDIKNMLNEAGKFMRRNRNDRLCLSHIQQAVRMDENLPKDLFFRLVLHEDCFRLPAGELNRTAGGVHITDPGPVHLVSCQESEPEFLLEPPAPSLQSGWLKLEQVLLKPVKRYPLTKEQQCFYELITEASVGSSELRRQRALQTLSTDPSVKVLLPTLSEFIADAVGINVTQQNVSLLLYLMRMVRALLGNSTVSLLQYLHLILPAVLSCLLTKQACPTAGSDDHWALREYSGNVMAQIVRHFEASDNSIMPRVIGTYKKALRMEPLTTVYGAVIGLGKLGNHAVRSCIVPQIEYLYGRIEPHLTASNGCSSSSVDKQAAKYIRHRVLKMCTSVLKRIHQAPDLPEQYTQAYGLLGPPLCYSVIVSRIQGEAVAAAKAESEAASRIDKAITTPEQLKVSRIAGPVCVGSKAQISTNQFPSNGIRRINDLPGISGSSIIPMSGLNVMVPPRLSHNPMALVKNQAIPGKLVVQRAQPPRFKNSSVPPAIKRPFSPANNAILVKSNKQCAFPSINNGFISSACNNGRKPITYLLK
ncbi:transcription initiation factor TFIID subunit 6 [Drosophila elegans]|uniref:transcription initiation factor TFIID subunit 6 n=1 Tax=Drosophila elegans TaxID=30023 RepID=UPI0007E829B2|nr:transcription initiation factor TFIID subunit 6 [Drosophila elegans]